MIYTDKAAAIQDIRWLTQKCALSYFASSRPTSYELQILENRIIDIKDRAILSFYESIFAMYALKPAQWNHKLLHSSLPVLALIPKEGMRIIIEKETDGNWKSEGRDGIRRDKTYPKGTIFSPIKLERKFTGKNTAKEMFKNVAREQKPIILHAAIASLSINIFALGTSFFSMQVYDRVIPTQGISTLIALSIGVFIAIFLEMILKIIRSHIFDHATKNMDTAYSHDIFHRFLNIRLDALPKSIGTLSGQLQSYTTVRAFISSAALYVFIDFPFSLIFLAVIIMIAGWTMGAIVSAFLIAAILTGIFFRKKIEKLTKASSTASYKKLGLLVESVEKAEDIKTTGTGWNILGRWNSLAEDAINDDIEIRHYTEMSNYITGFLQQFSYILLVATGAYLVSTTDSLTMGGLIATTILSGRVLSPIAMLPNLLVQWGKTKISIEDLDQVYTLDRDNEGVERPLSPSTISPHFRCQNISFAYEQNRPAIKVNHLTIAPGERVAVLGMIGSGKSTILKILAGLYKPQEGKVFIHGIDAHHISRNKLNEIIGYLPQSVKLISGTLRDNCTLGLTGISDEEIIEAAKITGLIHLINTLPQGLDTSIPEGGESVSGGQKQMISLTRLFLMNPPAWFLDEPTANMDEATEKKILEAIHETLTTQNTFILVTHKPALLSLVNRIIVITPQGIALDGPKDRVLQQLKSTPHNKGKI
ncbi:MAG: ATP-binding cassette domain-containing protein [Sulfurovum sp.]|nr:ATP-binding cassette domain-containing protein [Sulfurovum sp.]MDD3602826.1 ATP-binding cassette domain-containing protein [Sulfurovum sp.]